MVYKYNDQATEKGVYIVGACGFDSVPTDLGVEFARSQMSDGILASVEAYFSVKTGPLGAKVHFATYESAVYGLADVKNLRKLRRKFNHQPIEYVGRKLKPRSAMHYREELQKYAAPFPGSDASVVRRSQRFMSEKAGINPIQFSMYFLISGLWGVLMSGLVVLDLFFYVLRLKNFNIIIFSNSKIKYTLNLILKY